MRILARDRSVRDSVRQIHFLCWDEGSYPRQSFTSMLKEEEVEEAVGWKEERNGKVVLELAMLAPPSM